MQRYTFLQHPFYYFLLHSRQVISGLDKCVAVFYDSNQSHPTAVLFNGELSHYKMEEPVFLQELRTAGKQANWIKPEHVPFETKHNKEDQLTFMDEEKSSVLELRFKNPDDGYFDVLYLYFKNSIANFKLTNSDQAMAVTIKEVIQNLLYNQLTLQFKANYTNKQIHKKIAESVDLTEMQNKIKRLEEAKYNQLKNTYNYILQQLVLSETTDFALSDKAIEKLNHLNLSLEELSNVLVHSLEIIINKYGYKKFYEISDYDIVIPKNTSVGETTVKQQLLDKTAQFLDRYEQATIRLLAKNEKITGPNIGEACQPPISAAAISDILKKHQQKIIQLLQEHPEEWENIRSYFRPIATLSKSVTYNEIKRGA